MNNYPVEVKTDGGWTLHSTHESYRDAVDQSDMVHGRVLCPTGATDSSAWSYARGQQGFEGDFLGWQAQDDDERQGYENGAAGIPTG